MDKSSQLQDQLRAMNEALILGSVRQHELTAAAESLNAQLRAEITERKRAKDDLARLAAIVESSQDAIVSEDLRGTITSWNRGAETIFGYSAQEIVGQSIERLIPPERRAEEAGILARVVRGDGVRDFETVRRRKDGSSIEVSITVSPVKDASGAVVGIAKMARDISARKLVEESLRQNAALFSALIAQAPMGTYVVDAQFRMHQVNAEALPAFASIQPLIGRDFQEVLEILWGPELGGQIAGIFRHTLTTGERYISPPFTERRHDLGIEQTYEWETQRVTLPDGQQGVVCYFNEVTERAHAMAALAASEQRARLATEATQVGIWEWNLITNRIRWDAQMFRIYGIEPTSDGFVDYADWCAAVEPEELAENEAILQDTVRRCGRSERAFRIRRRDDGQCRHISAVETVRVNPQGQAEWVLGTNLDVTGRQEVDDNLRHLASQLADADRRKDAFLATLSHELRNPLASVGLDLHLLQRAGDNREAVERSRRRMERQVAVLIRLIDDLMDVSRISQEKLTLQSERLDLASVVQHALESSRSVLEKGAHPVTTTLPPQSLTVVGDSTRLAQVLDNLLTNAAKYSDRGRPISVTVEPHGDFAEVRVRDQGIGIAPTDLPRLFELFSQVNAAEDRSQGGLGIGLHLVKRLVEMHGGDVEARSAGLGQGSEFIVRLPLAVAANAEVKPPTDEGEATGASGQCRILVADDNQDATDSLAMLLTLDGHKVRTAGDGLAAVNLAAVFRPDVILLDIGMPTLNGYEACRRIRKQPWAEHAVLIALTGWGQDADKRRSQEVGFNHHMVKPLDYAALMHILASLPGASAGERTTGASWS